jgi:hypothetical protein
VPESSQIERDTDALYELRPGEFVAARDALAKRLRAEGRRAEADAVKGLPRPTVAAWAVNQLARREPEWTRALATAGQRLEEAQTALIEQGDRTAWREATAAQRESIERLARMAERLLRDERGAVSPALRDAIRETLQAATIDPEARAAVSAGRLDRELRASGLLGADASARRTERRGVPAEEDDGAATGRSGRGATAPPKTARSDARAKGEAAAKGDAAAPAKRPAAPDGSSPAKRSGNASAARSARAEAAARRATAEREARAARRTAERQARATLRRVEREATAARTAADRADKALGRARKAHDAAASQLADAQEALDQRTADLERAEAEQQRVADVVAARDEAIAAARADLDRVLKDG